MQEPDIKMEERKICDHKDERGEWTVIVVDGQYEQCLQCGLMGK